jgi:pyruvate/2-oxoglutarate dehydrogenase complex dihydrolipoamide dehydrogenase (E3) component
MTEHYDIIIIGTGAGGGTLAVAKSFFGTLKTELVRDANFRT